MSRLTDQGSARVSDIASREGLSPDAVQTLLMALAQGGGTQAQFSHPELGGMGQWSQGGMVMVGDMFNNGLKAQVDRICTELAGALNQGGLFAPVPMPGGQSQQQGGGMMMMSGGIGWPAELGAPSSQGAQNDMRYAVFPATRRLAVEEGGRMRVFDTGEHMIGGVSQQQPGGRTLTFSSQFGTVQLSDLREIGGAGDAAPEAEAAPAAEPAPAPSEPAAATAPAAEPEPAPAEPAPAPAAASAPAAPGPAGEGDVIAQIERLAGLRDKGILSDEEFSAKKTELLSRL